jgi:hypothetical protein
VATVATIALAVVVGVVGRWNPWHLTYLDLAFTWPFLGVVFLAGAGMLWHVVVGRLELAGLIVLLLSGVALSGVAVVESELDDPAFRQRATNAENDVEVSLTSLHNVWDVWLRANRGMRSRQHLVARIGVGDSAPPSVEVRFTAADRLVVASDGQDVYQVRYDPGSLDIEDETCRPFRAPIGVPGCMT